MLTLENDLARACLARIQARILELQAADFTGDPDSRQQAFSSELNLYERISKFRFADYPDYTAPWHLLTWPRMRWDHVYQIVSILEAFKQPTGSHVGRAITLDPFQIMILLAFLGPEKEDGLRLVREGLLTIARKNGKTVIVAGLATALMLIHPDDHGLLGQEIQVGASDREQAGITHTMADRFSQLDDALGIRDKFHSVPSKKTMQHRTTLTMLKCLSSDAYRAHGGNPAMVLLDEIGNVPKSAAQEFYSVLTTGFAAQDEPLTLLLSTQAPNDEHFFSQQVDRGKRINEAMVEDDEFAAFVFTVPETDADGEDVDPFDESLWYLGNPGLGTIASWSDMRDWAKKAKALPDLKNTFQNLKLNQRVSETASFVTRTTWQRNTGHIPEFEELFGRTCYLGLDLAETTDLTSLVALFESIEGEPLIVLSHFWIPGNDLAGRAHRDHVPYDVWRDKGLIDTSSSNKVDYEKVAEKIVEYIKNYDVAALGFDRWKMKYLSSELVKFGYEFTKEDGFLIEIGQGFKDQSRSVEVLEGLLLDGNLAHGGHPILKWNAGNAVIVKDETGARKFNKAKSYGRIDGVVALALAAHARDTLGVSGVGESIYANQNVDVFM